MPHPSDTTGCTVGVRGRAWCARVCVRVRLRVLARLRCRYERCCCVSILVVVVLVCTVVHGIDLRLFQTSDVL